MGFSSFLRKAVGTNVFGGNTLDLFGGSKAKADGTPYTPQEITTSNLFNSLTPDQKKDLLINNPNINGPNGSQSYDPATNTISLKESDFQKAQRLRQEGLAEQLSGSLNGNLDTNNEAVQKATFERGKALLDPTYKQQRRELMQELADQGLPIGSEGYNEALDRFDQSQNRAYTDLSQASIQTSEAVRQQRFNEISSLLGNAQIGGVGFQQFQPQMSGLDLFGAEQSRNQMANNNANLNKQLKQSNRNALYGALGGAGSAAIMAAFSDKNLKENIEVIGQSESGIPICEFDYKDKKFGTGRYRGVLAQDVEKIIPEAVITSDDGYRMVDYSMIDVNFGRID